MGSEASTGPPAAAEPDGLASCQWRVRNTGDGAATFTLDVVGEPAAWSWVSPATLSLGPGEEGEAKVMFRPPRASSPAAGPVPYQLRIARADDPTDATLADGVVTVGAYTDLFTSVEPRTAEARAESQFQVCVENRGNAPVRAEVTAVDAHDALAFRVDPPALDVAPGQLAKATVTARTRGRRFLGSPRSHPFQVVAEAPGTEPVRLGATFVQRPRSPKWALLPLVGVVLVGLVGSLLASNDGSTSSTTIRPLSEADSDERDRQSLDRTCPANGHLATEANGISRPGPTPFSYSFLFVKQDRCMPYRFNPCEPIRYVTNDARATAEHRADFAEALRRVTEATGIEFVHEGPTDEVPGPRGPYVPRYGQRWAPVLVAWVGSDTITGLLRTGAGRGVTATTTTLPVTTITGAGAPTFVGEVYVSGMLLINVEAIDPDTRSPVRHGFGPGVNWGRVLLHELGHLLGLGHVESRTSIMQHQLGLQRLPNASWGIGDLNALKVLGREFGCEQTPAFTTGPHGAGGPLSGRPPGG